MAMGDQGDPAVGRTALAKASWRLLPLLGLGYGIAYMDRINISFAALQMNADLGFSAAVYGLGGGLFFLGYALCEVPSNLILARVGARVWIARIMLTWGLIAVGMMFVRTPVQFYAMRFLLGMAEAGFFPGVVFYLMGWFPSAERGRAISRFYVALPISITVMGGLAGTLLGLRGHFGLAGWQWLFLVEGVPAIAMSVVILLLLPNGPGDAAWLSVEEKAWIAQRLSADRAAVGSSGDPGVGRALVDPRVWLLGLCNMCILACAYAFNLSAPTILVAETHQSAGGVGYVTAIAGLVAGAGMLLAGWISDRRGERHLLLVGFLTLAAVGYVILASFHSPWSAIGAYALITIATTAVQAVFWLVPSDVLHGRSAAAGVAAIGSIGMVGAFLGPWAWGVARDQTGAYQVGFLALAVLSTVASGILLLVRHRARVASAAVALAQAAPL